MNLIPQLSFSGCSWLGSGTEGTGKAVLPLELGKRHSARVGQEKIDGEDCV